MYVRRGHGGWVRGIVIVEECEELREEVPVHTRTVVWCAQKFRDG